MFVAYITPAGLPMRREELHAAHPEQARLFAQHRGISLYGKRPFSFIVKAA